MTSDDSATRNRPTDALVPDPVSFGSEDPRTAFASSVALATSVIAAVGPEQMTDATPCDRYDVRGILGHLVAVLRRVAVVGTGGNPHSVPPQVDGVDDLGWVDAWTTAAHEVRRVWTDDGVLDRIVHVPWADLPGRDALAIYVNEISVHTWDLAVATSQHPAWDDGVVTTAMAAVVEQMPAEGRHERFEVARAQMQIEASDWPDPFFAVVAVDDDAAPIERLVAFNGRDPRWAA